MKKVLVEVITILSLLALANKALGLSKEEKLTHIHFFFHDIVGGLNATVAHVAGPGLGQDPVSGFGATFVMDDPLTVGPERDSKLVGWAQGMYSSASRSEVRLLMALNYVFTEGKLKGSTLSILGHNPILSKLREMPILGGTGTFRLARGYAQAKTHAFNVVNGDAVVEYNVYVLHY